ncbi:MAG: Lrp/AsnC family transcriptional regulator [Promethearchaeota archaeon]
MIKKTFKELLGIDDDDYKIIELIEKNPDITHSEIAREIEKSQPAVGARIIKLERKHLLTKQVGFNIKNVDIKVAIVFISTKDVDKIVEKIKKCPFINHAFKISGEFNLLPNVINVKTNILIESVHDFVIPIDFQIEKFDFHSNNCGPDCNLNVNLPKYKFNKETKEED